MNENQIFQINNLSFAYQKQKPLIKELNLQIERGKITALLGTNGCGKSTLFRLIGGLYKPDSGSIILNNKDLSKVSRKSLAKQIAIVHQYNTAPADLTVRQLVGFGRTPYRTFSTKMTLADQEAIDRALELTKTMSYESVPISHLSGGERQRVWLALALAQSTDALLLDEITTYLDIYYQYELLRLLQQLNQERGMTIFMIVHDLNHALEFCQNVILMKAGQVLASGPTDKVITSPLIQQAFGINSQIIKVNKKSYCVFEGSETCLID